MARLPRERTGADHHVGPAIDDRSDEVVHRLGRKLVVAVGQDVDVCLDITKGGSERESLPQARLSKDLRAGRRRDVRCVIRRAVVDDPDGSVGQLLLELRDHGSDRGFLVEARNKDRDALPLVQLIASNHRGRQDRNGQDLRPQDCLGHWTDARRPGSTVVSLYGQDE
jgi:hypothetical protein